MTFYQANAEELSQTVPVEPYDLVYSFGVVHHTPNPERAIAEISRYVAVEGTVKIMVYNRRSVKVLATVLTEGKGDFRKLDEIVARHSEAQTGCPVTYTYSRKSAKTLLQAHGLRVTDCDVDHIFPYRVKDYINYVYLKRLWVRALPPPLFRVLEHQLGWHICLTAVPQAPVHLSGQPR